MADRHKRHPITFRPAESDRNWLEAYAAREDRPVRAVLAEALAEYRHRRDPPGDARAAG